MFLIEERQQYRDFSSKLSVALLNRIGELGLHLDWEQDNPSKALRQLKYGQKLETEVIELVHNNNIGKFLEKGKTSQYVKEKAQVTIDLDWRSSDEGEYPYWFNREKEKLVTKTHRAIRYYVGASADGREELKREEAPVSLVAGLSKFKKKGLTADILELRYSGPQLVTSHHYYGHYNAGHNIGRFEQTDRAIQLRGLMSIEFELYGSYSAILDVYVNGRNPIESAGVDPNPLTKEVIEGIFGIIADELVKRTASRQSPEHETNAKAKSEPANSPEKETHDRKGEEDGAKAVELVAFDILDANPLYAPDGTSLIKDRKLSTLLEGGQLREGTTADGVSQLLLRLELSGESNVTIALHEEADGRIELLSGLQSRKIGERYYAFALYTPPDVFSSLAEGEEQPKSPLVPPRARHKKGPASRDVSLSIRIEGSKTAPIEKNLVLARPPVVLVHGLFSDPVQTWANSFDTELFSQTSMVVALERAGFVPFLVDYRNTNGITERRGSWISDDESSSFEANKRVVWDSPEQEASSFLFEYGLNEETNEPYRSQQQKPENARIGGIKQALAHYRDAYGLASTQAIVVGHSMGGLLARVWASEAYNSDYKRAENFFEGDINRLVTLNTPHHGSELMELKDALGNPNVGGESMVQWVRKQFANTIAWWYLEPVPHAIRDLRPESPALKKIGETKLPVFAIATTGHGSHFGKARKDPLNQYNMLYSLAGTIFFNNDPLLDAFISQRFEDWKSADKDLRILDDSYEEKQAQDVSADEGRELYRESIRKALDYNVYFWVQRRSADYWDDFKGDVAKLAKLPFGVIDTSMGNDEELELLNASKVMAKSAIGADPSRFFNDKKVKDIPEIFLTMLHDLVFHHDGHTDAVVRVESQLGGLKGEAPIPNILHSYAPWDYQVQSKLVRLLRWDHNQFKDKFPEAGKALPRYLPPKSAAPDLVLGDEAIAWSGMVASHAEQFLRIARQENVFILGRPVNQDSTRLLEQNIAAAKGMNVKGKSSTWGPQVAMIPFDQRFSKLWRTVKDPAQRKVQIKKYNKQTKSSIEKVHPQLPDERTFAIKRPLEVENDHRGTCEVLTNPDEPNAEAAIYLRCGKFYYDWRNSGSTDSPVYDESLDMKRAQVDDKLASLLDANPMYVLADNTSDHEIKPYLTADYDLLAIGYPFDAAQCNAGLKQCMPAETPAVRDAPFDPLLGATSPRQQNLLAKLNEAVSTYGGFENGFVSHHGPENQYKDSPYVDYPIIVFDPTGKTESKDQIYLIRQGPPGFRDLHLKRFFSKSNRLGYNLWPNPASEGWKWGDYDPQRGYRPRDYENLPVYVDEAPRPKPVHVAGAKQPASKVKDEEAGEAEIKTEEEGKGTANDLAKAESNGENAKEIETGAAVKQSDAGKSSDNWPDPFLYKAGSEDDELADVDLKQINRLARLGHVGAQVFMARHFGSGSERSLFWNEKAAEKDDVRALNALFHIFNRKSATEEQKKNALVYLKRAAYAGDPASMMDMAMVLETGQGAEKNLAKARDWLQKAADLGSAEAHFLLAQMLVRNSSKDSVTEAESVFRHYYQAARMDDVDAQKALAHYYRFAGKVRDDNGQATTWYKRASQNSDAEADRILGQHYGTDGASRDLPVSHAYWSLALLHEPGRKDVQQALKRLEARMTQERREKAKLVYERLRSARLSKYQAKIRRSWNALYQALMVCDLDAAFKARLELDEMQAKNMLPVDQDGDYSALYAWLSRLLQSEEALLRIEKGDPRAAMVMTTHRKDHACLRKRVEKLHHHLKTFDIVPSEHGQTAGPLRALAEVKLQSDYAFGSDEGNEHAMPTEYLRSLARLAALGQVRAQRLLGWHYYSGLWIKKDGERAFYWYEKAAQSGDANAQLALYSMLRNGFGILKDEKLAIEWLHRSAENGWPDSQVLLGVRYEKGSFVEKDPLKAFRLFEKAAQQESGYGLFALAHAYERGVGVSSDWEKAQDLYLKAAEEGYHAAQTRIGLDYLRGSGVEKDIDKAVKWLLRARNNGSAEAAYELGGIYLRGNAKTQDFTKAYNFLLDAKELGYRDLDRDISDLRRSFSKEEWQKIEDEHIPARSHTSYDVWWDITDWTTQYGDALKDCDIDRSMRRHTQLLTNFRHIYISELERLDKLTDALLVHMAYWEANMAAEAGYPQQAAELEISDDMDACLKANIAGLRSRVTTTKRAAEGGQKRAEISDATVVAPKAANDNDKLLADFALLRKYVRKGLAKANELTTYLPSLRAMADDGLPQAQYELGLCYEEGHCGLVKDRTIAMEFFSMATNQGHGDAMARLGLALLDTGMTPDSKRALSHFRAAADGGSALGVYGLGRCSELGSCGVASDDASALAYYEQAAGLKNALALWRLGWIYETAQLGVKEDLARAAEFYRQSANLGHDQGQESYAYFLENGSGGVKKDLRNAGRLYRLAGEQGRPEFQFILADIYERGELGIQKDLAQAERLYRSAADGGDASAYLRLALLLDRDDASDRDLIAAAEALLEAYRAGDEGAVLFLNEQVNQKLSIQLRQVLQRFLKDQGFYLGPIDGQIGETMISAIDGYAKRAE
ncbi:MAG: hypothetical protein N4A65_01875 [Cohaesibacter sp.]|nr:hypothetical protein [Cohaesibacter sp.]